MPKINTGYWVRVVDGRVRDVWSSAPDDRPGWREAIEIFPDIEPGDREVIEGHIFDLEKTPVEIVYQKRPVAWEERRDSFVAHAEFKVEAAKREQEALVMADPSKTIDQSKIDEAIAERDALLAVLKAVTSHEDLDKIQL